MARLQLGIYAVAHFLVDLGCALLLLGQVCPDWNPAAAILLYNLLAFAVQMPMGILADRLGGCHLFAAGGCLAVLAGWMAPRGMAAVLLAGAGNAAFHVGGGLDTLNGSGKKAGPLGLFVSPGAFGVYLGTCFAASISPVPICAALAAMAVVLAACRARNGKKFGIWGQPRDRAIGKGQIDNAFFKKDATKDGFKFWIAVICLFVVVVLRSLLGLAVDFSWKVDWGFWAVCAVAGGKAAGGYLADRFGVMPVAAGSLGLSACCFLGSGYPAAGLAALFLFNMTMPLTLWAMARLFPGMKGFSFGLLTFALFLGFLPVYFGWGGLGPMTLAFGTIYSLPLLVFGLWQVERGMIDVG